MLDCYGRKIDYLRMSVTDMCNLKCRYCMPEQGIEKIKKSEILSLEEIEKITLNLADLGIKRIRITGGEPLLRKNIISLIKKLSIIKGIDKLALTTNGVLLKIYARDLKDAGINSLNISLDTLDKRKYSYITRSGDIKDVLLGLEFAKNMNFDSLKINVVLIKGINDDEIEHFVSLTKDNKIDIRFIELMPIGNLFPFAHKNFMSCDTVLSKVQNLYKLENQDNASPAVYYKLENALGRIGLIRAVSGKFCAFCNRIRLSADGKLKTCLHKDDVLDVKNLSRNGKDLKSKIKALVFNKPMCHELEKKEYIKNEMPSIGG